jgi:chitinase
MHGVAGFGRAYKVAKEDAIVYGQMQVYPPYSASLLGNDMWDGSSAGGHAGTCGLAGSYGSGLIDYWALIKYGFLNANGTAASGMMYRYGSCSSTVCNACASR